MREKNVIFDFDGTISTLRHGWEQIMQPLMLEMICPEGQYSDVLVKKVRDYIDASTGIQTAYQMQWLADEVKKATGKAEDVWYYKARYNEKLLDMVSRKKQLVLCGRASRSDYLIEGSVSFLAALRERGCKMYLASGTDDADVRAEAAFLGVDGFFADIKGAPSGSFGCSKELVMCQLMEQSDGADMVVVGDGRVEIELSKHFGALSIGVASDEDARHGVNAHKKARLQAAGADVICGDFTDADTLIARIFEG